METISTSNAANVNNAANINQTATALNLANSSPVLTGNQQVTHAISQAAFFPMADASEDLLANGMRYSKHIKKGENSKLVASVAISIPALSENAVEAQAYLDASGLRDYLVSCVEKLQDGYIKSRAIAGAKVIEFSELNPAQLVAYLASSEEGEGIGQLSATRIQTWFDTKCRDMYLVALADRLGISENATDAEIKRLEQIANQTRDNLAKLSSKKPVQLDTRVKAALEWALQVTSDSSDSSGLTGRLQAKLAQPIADDINLADMLGM